MISKLGMILGEINDVVLCFSFYVYGSFFPLNNASDLVHFFNGLLTAFCGDLFLDFGKLAIVNFGK